MDILSAPDGQDVHPTRSKILCNILAQCGSVKVKTLCRRSYQFVYIEPGNPPIYYLLPELNLMETERSNQLLEVLKAICQL